MISLRTGSILGAGILLAFFNLASRVMGLVRDRILASRLGASDVLDVYYISFQIPDFIFNLLVIGAISSVFIPVFIEYESKKGLEQAWKLTSNFLNILTALLLVFVGSMFILAPFLLDLIAPGFSEEKRSMAVLFTRVMMFSPLIFGVSMIAGSVLQSLNRFLSFAMAPLAYNLGIIIGVLFLEPLFGPLGLAEGVVLGAVLHLAIQLPALKRTGFKWFWIFDTADEGLRKILKLIAPRSLGLAAVQINWIVLNSLATTLGIGVVSSLNFAYNLHFVPIALIGISMAIASFPVISKDALSGREVLSPRVFKILNQILFVIIPLSFIFAYMKNDIVAILLGAGMFGPKEIGMTAGLLGFFMIGVFAQSIIPVLARSFYAMQNTLIPVMASIISVAFNVFLAVSFIGETGKEILPISFSLAGILNMTILIYFLGVKIKLDIRKLALNFVKIFYSSVMMLLVIILIDIPLDFSSDLAGSILQVGALSLAGMLTFLFFSSILGIKIRSSE